MFSYWEQQSLLQYDHIIAGAGIVGLSTAIELKQKFPDSSVLVLERGLFSTGASTRNAGFACMGSVTELLDDLKIMSEHEVIHLFEKRKKGLELLRKRLGDNNIGYEENGSYELINHDENEALDKIDYLNELLFPITKKPAFKIQNGKIKEFGFAQHHINALIENTCEGALHTGKMIRALTDYAIRKCVEIKTGAEVLSFEENENHVFVSVKDPFRNDVWRLQSKTLSICTNAFTKQLLPDADIIPGRGQVLITKPIPNLKFKGIFHFNKGYYYFREIDGRILFGGGRNLDIETEKTTEFAINEMIQIDLEKKLHEIIIPNIAIQIEQRWCGIMAFGNNKNPIIQAFSDRVFGAFRMGGMGVALGSEAAREMVNLIQKNSS